MTISSAQEPLTVAIIGTGFVGAVSAAVYASFGNMVIGLDIDEQKVAALRQGKVPFFEPGLEELLQQEQTAGRLTFTTSYQEVISTADVIMIAVGTPSSAEGKVNLDYVYAASEALAPHLKQDAVVVVKSTVPPGTLDEVRTRIDAHAEVAYTLASVPEFLREGTAVEDTLIGAESDAAFAILEQLHAPLKAPVVRVNPISAQMAKYTANAYLATRITFINQIADLCEHTGADIEEVIESIGHDKRIGHQYWYPGFGYGGSCFPKDVKELAHYSRTVGLGDNLLNQLDRLNEERIPTLLEAYSDWIGGFEGKKVAVLGLSFKPNTNDMREAPSTHLIPALLDAGATVAGYDPKAMEEAAAVIPAHDYLTFVPDLSEACENADVIIALIEWPEIIEFDYASVRTQRAQWFIDARNQFDPKTITSAGFKYRGVGRKTT